MTTPATTPADGELLQRIAENDPSWVLKYLEQNTRFDVPRIRELFEFAKAQATAMLATPSPGKAPEPVADTSDEDAYVIDRLGGMLADIAIVLKGPEEAKHRHSYHDLVETATVMKLELDLYRATYGETLASPGKAEAEDAARYRVLRDNPSFALTMGQWSTPGIIDALCDKALQQKRGEHG